MACAFVLTGAQLDMILQSLRLLKTLLYDMVEGQPEGFITWTASGLRLLVAQTGVRADFKLLSSSEHEFILCEPGGEVVALHSLLLFFQKLPRNADAVVKISAAGGRLAMEGQLDCITHMVSAPAGTHPALPADLPPEAVRNMWGACPTRAWPALHEAQALQRTACWGAAAVNKAAGERFDGNILRTIKDAVVGPRGAWPDWLTAEDRAAIDRKLATVAEAA